MVNEKGFTLIELVVVIILLGILSSVALPRFLSLSDDAHDAAAKGIFTAFESGITQFKSLCLIRGGDKPTTIHGLSYPEINLNSSKSGSCYPSAATGRGTGDGRTSDFQDCLEVFSEILVPAPPHNTAKIPATNDDYINAGSDYTVLIKYRGLSKCEYYYVASKQGLNSPKLEFDSKNGTLNQVFN